MATRKDVSTKEKDDDYKDEKGSDAKAQSNCGVEWILLPCGEKVSFPRVLEDVQSRMLS